MPSNRDQFGPAIYGTATDDIIYDTVLFQNIYGLAGDDLIVAAAVTNAASGPGLEDVFNGGIGSDIVSYKLADAPVIASLATNLAHRLLAGGTLVDQDRFVMIERLVGSAFGDELTGNDWANRLWGGGGADELQGEGGNDQLHGGTGDDVVFGEGGDDTIHGDAGDDILDGTEGDDLVFGGDGDDYLDGGWDDDTLHGEAGDDQILGHSGDDVVEGDAGDDHLEGMDGQDVVSGDDGADILYGNGGTDVLDGGADDDWLAGGAGDDELTGGSGADVFGWSYWETPGLDQITDFDLGLDRLWFEDGFFADEPGDDTPLSGVLWAYDLAGDALLTAYTADGFAAIAVLDGVGAAALNGMIEDGSILAEGGPPPVELWWA